MLWSVIGWVLWCAAALYALVILLPTAAKRRDPGLRFMQWVQATAILAALAATVLFPVSKLHLLWALPLAYLAPFIVMAVRLRGARRRFESSLQDGSGSSGPEASSASDELAAAEAALRSKQNEVARAREDIERAIHSLKPTGDSPEPFHPSFATWWQRDGNQDFNLDQALEAYILEYDLLAPVDAAEPEELTMLAAKVAILRVEPLGPAAGAEDDYAKYTSSLYARLSIHRIRWKAIQAGRKPSHE